MDRFSFLNAAHTDFFADLYEQYLQNPDSVEPSWRAFFQGYDFANEYSDSVDELVQDVNNSHLQKEFDVIRLINAYRRYGHLLSQINPLKERKVDNPPNLSIEAFGLSNDDLNTVFEASKVIQLEKATLQEIIAHLQNVYCGTIGVEFEHTDNEDKINWITEYFEKGAQNLPANQQKEILSKLIKSSAFESFFHTKYVGQKRFSIEGLEAFVPAMNQLFSVAAQCGMEDVVMGMAHRGRLNVLANLFNKAPKNIFTEFDGKDYADVDDSFDGDVKYHLGYSTNVSFGEHNLNINLAPNPSHLETVGAVIEGVSRALQDKYYEDNPSKVLPIAIHGDAAVAGQGIVYEIVQMSGLRGFETHGTIHVVLNNQVGFTTNQSDARTSEYSTDVAKVIAAPVLHVNADDAEAAVRAFLFALAYRNRFNEDVFIDLIGYRKYGHNEGDEPKFTQPLLYKLISKHQKVTTQYTQQLIEGGVITEQEAKDIEKEYKDLLEQNLEEARSSESAIVIPFMQTEWEEFKIADQQMMLESYNTQVDEKLLDEVAEVLTELPENKQFIKKTQRLINDRKAMYYEKDRLDWAMGELLAYGSLIAEGFDVRFSGQDVERGTFSHRHAVLTTEDTEEKYVPLNQLKDKKGQMRIYNSLLSEYAVLGFEYGYSITNPKALTIWEAQFGDFSNGAQIVTDQYISSGEDKWGNQSGVVMLLPHGYEHQGAEHSSARLERFLQLSSQQNMYVVNTTTPANQFHLLRRQMMTNYRKPLVVMSPKSLLRHPKAVSTKEEFTAGMFKTVIDDPQVSAKETIKTLVFVSGKFYYDLIAERENLGRNDIAFVRIEQLFPLDKEKIKAIIDSYPNIEEYIWAQEEPRNMGAYSYMLMNFDLVKFTLASPPDASAPASGSVARSQARHKAAIQNVFNKLEQ